MSIEQLIEQLKARIDMLKKELNDAISNHHTTAGRLLEAMQILNVLQTASQSQEEPKTEEVSV